MVAQNADTVMLASANFSPGWFAWIIIGGIAGWIASKIMGTDKDMGIIKNVLAGVIGGWLGGYVLRLFDVQTGAFGWFLTFVTALVGACVVIGAVKLVTGRKGSHRRVTECPPTGTRTERTSGGAPPTHAGRRASDRAHLRHRAHHRAHPAHRPAAAPRGDPVHRGIPRGRRGGVPQELDPGSRPDHRGRVRRLLPASRPRDAHRRGRRGGTGRRRGDARRRARPAARAGPRRRAAAPGVDLPVGVRRARPAGAARRRRRLRGAHRRQVPPRRPPRGQRPERAELGAPGHRARARRRRADRRPRGAADPHRLRARRHPRAGRDLRHHPVRLPRRHVLPRRHRTDRLQRPARGGRRDRDRAPAVTDSSTAPHRPVGVMILPSMLTVAALCAGLTGVRFAADGKVDLAIMLVVIAAILDGLDGRVARLLGASTRIGAELDSLADAINFGVTPALILYFVCFPGSPAGWIVALLYVVAMVLRLARFNTLAADPTAPAYTKDFFVGVPAPAGALLVLAPLAAQQEWGDGWWVSTPMVAAWTLFVAALTVSRIPTSSFKTMTVQPAKAAGVLVAVAGLAALILTYPYIALLLVIALYLLHIPFAWRSKRWVTARPEAWDRKPAERRAMRREQRRPVRPHRRAATAGRGGRRTAARLGLRRPTREDGGPLNPSPRGGAN